MIWIVKRTLQKGFIVEERDQYHIWREMIEDVRRGLKVKPLNSIHHQSCHILQQVNHYQSIETVVIRIQIAKGTVSQI